MAAKVACSNAQLQWRVRFCSFLLYVQAIRIRVSTLGGSSTWFLLPALNNSHYLTSRQYMEISRTSLGTHFITKTSRNRPRAKMYRLSFKRYWRATNTLFNFRSGSSVYHQFRCISDLDSSGKKQLADTYLPSLMGIMLLELNLLLICWIVESLLRRASTSSPSVVDVCRTIKHWTRQITTYVITHTSFIRRADASSRVQNCK